jgi:hypothetical protein
VNLNVAVCIPANSNSPNHFWLSTITVLAALNKERVKGYDSNGAFILQKVGSILPQLRYNLVKEAIAQGASHVLFVDSDQTFPAQLVHCLARHKKPVVACNIAVKTLPSKPTARRKSEKWWGGDVVYTRPESTGLEQVWRVGCGVMLVEVGVFEKLPKPWFHLKYMPEIDDFMGEDWYFCELLENAGIPIYIDHDASKRVGHIGNFTFGHEHVEVTP